MGGRSRTWRAGDWGGTRWGRRVVAWGWGLKEEHLELDRGRGEAGRIGWCMVEDELERVFLGLDDQSARYGGRSPCEVAKGGAFRGKWPRWRWWVEGRSAAYVISQTRRSSLLHCSGTRGEGGALATDPTLCPIAPRRAREWDSRVRVGRVHEPRRLGNVSQEADVRKFCGHQVAWGWAKRQAGGCRAKRTSAPRGCSGRRSVSCAASATAAGR